MLEYYIERWEQIYWRNVQDGFPHFNSYYHVRNAYPHMAAAILDAYLDMVVSGYEKGWVDVFIESYKRPCREVRKEWAESRRRGFWNGKRASEDRPEDVPKAKPISRRKAELIEAAKLETEGRKRRKGVCPVAD